MSKFDEFFDRNQIALLREAMSSGRKLMFCDEIGDWFDVDDDFGNIYFNNLDDCRLMVAPKTIVVNGITIEAPLEETPKVGDTFFVTSPDVIPYRWSGSFSMK